MYAKPFKHFFATGNVLDPTFVRSLAHQIFNGHKIAFIFYTCMELDEYFRYYLSGEIEFFYRSNFFLLFKGVTVMLVIFPIRCSIFVGGPLIIGNTNPMLQIGTHDVVMWSVWNTHRELV